MSKIDVTLDADRLVETLSVAERQLVAICRAIAADARLVIMDEPTSSLTRQEVDALFKVVRDLQQKNYYNCLCQSPAQRSHGNRRKSNDPARRTRKSQPARPKTQTTVNSAF